MREVRGLLCLSSVLPEQLWSLWTWEPQLPSPCAASTEACAARARALQQEKTLPLEAVYHNYGVAPAHCN